MSNLFITFDDEFILKCSFKYFEQSGFDNYGLEMLLLSNRTIC